jgi:hypothetical protein
VSFLSEFGEDQSAQVFQTIWEGPMKRRDLAKLPSLRTHADPSDLVKAFPQLAEFMTCAMFEGSKERRESPTVTLWAAGGQWKASVKDREEGLVLWLSAPGFRELVQLLEDFCQSSDAPWRHDDQAHERNGKRVKK